MSLADKQAKAITGLPAQRFHVSPPLAGILAGARFFRRGMPRLQRL
jgi:hypothetical protein